MMLGVLRFVLLLNAVYISINAGYCVKLAITCLILRFVSAYIGNNAILLIPGIFANILNMYLSYLLLKITAEANLAFASLYGMIVVEFSLLILRLLVVLLGGFAITIAGLAYMEENQEKDIQ